MCTPRQSSFFEYCCAGLSYARRLDITVTSWPRSTKLAARSLACCAVDATSGWNAWFNSKIFNGGSNSNGAWGE